MKPTTNCSGRSLIQIVPSLSPVIDGIGDYALQLARQLRAQCGVETSFIVCDPKWPRKEWSAEFDAVGLEKHSGKQLLDAVGLLSRYQNVSNSPILLQFSPYGYQKRGLPLWLIRAVEKIERSVKGRVSVAFHELDVKSSRVLSSAFWVSPMQRSAIRRLLKIARFAYTNTGLHRSKLQAWGRTDVAFIPNFSNMGEVESAPAMTNRAREVVIFGRADQRRWTYTHGADALAIVCEHIKATRIIDVGAPIPGDTRSSIGATPIVRRGVLPGSAVAAIMRSALATFMYYPVPLLTKSGVHALACASATIPFVFTDEMTQTACMGLTAGVDYIVVSREGSLPPRRDLECLAPAIYSSYCKRTSKVAALTIAERLYGPVREAGHVEREHGTPYSPPAASVPEASFSLADFEKHEVAL